MKFHALIRTHHITSRQKVRLLKAAARDNRVACLLRSGGVPGLMYVRGSSREAVQGWVDAVHGLRYKDYSLVAPTAPVPIPVPGPEETAMVARDGGDGLVGTEIHAGLEEVGHVNEFAKYMEGLGLREWWRARMGFTSAEEK